MEVVKTRYGQLIASRNDIYIGRGLFEYGEFSEAEVEFFRKVIQKNDIVCDVGANIGTHTLAFSRLARHVYAFEPQPMLYHALCGMIALNELSNVTTIHAGCYSREGTLSYAPLVMDQPNNFGALSLQPFSPDRAIRVVKLITDCQFLKVDVEGMELDVLRGATEMIRRCKPVMYVEADRKEKFPALLDYIHTLGYRAYWHTPALFNPQNFNGKSEDIWGGVASFNLICSPEPVSTWGESEAVEFPKDFQHQDFKSVVASLA